MDIHDIILKLSEYNKNNDLIWFNNNHSNVKVNELNSLNLTDMDYLNLWTVNCANIIWG